MWMYPFKTKLFLSKSPDIAAMFPGRFPNVPESMWNFGWTPAAMGFQGQFCGGDVMNQQSQAQSQAQTQAQLAQAQLAQLREQNSILNQQLASQAQSHIQHLQQLLPFHQQASTPPPTQSTSHAQEPPTPVAPTSNQPAASALFNPEEMLKQMKDTVVSTMKDVVEKNQERPISHPPAMPPDLPPMPIHPPTSSHPPPPVDFPPAVPIPHRRSRSHHHRPHSERPDKRPISSHRSPRRKRSIRRTNRSSKPRSTSRRRRTTSRHRSPATSVTLRSASPRHRDRPERRHDDQEFHQSTHPMTTLQPAKWDYYEPQQTTVPATYPHQSYYDKHYTTKWKSWGQWKDYSKSHGTKNHPGEWIDYTQPPLHDNPPHDDSTKPLTAYSSGYHTSHHHSRRHSHRSGSIQSRASTNVPPGHVAIDLHAGSTKNWARAVKFALDHPDRMRAANEIPSSELPQPSTTMEEEQYTKACEELHKVDQRIPKEIVERAVQLFFSTNLLPDYDLSTCYTIDLHSTNMIALIMPLPQSNQFKMPPPFGKSKNYNWALVHGTTVTIPRSTSSWRARSDRPIGPITRTLNDVTCHRSVHSSSEDRLQTLTVRFHRGPKKNSLAQLTRRAKANRNHPRGDVPRCLRAHCIQSWRQ